ncbi:serine hydrolase domain-containing protein [Parapedobacter sp. DT-150]|uniref:serine hydrolase domain-containing protein n=1 Tax=Parapedobacter sp. DT-150 TaxID=3396162 RepID=UPI003F1C2EDA
MANLRTWFLPAFLMLSWGNSMAQNQQLQPFNPAPEINELLDKIHRVMQREQMPGLMISLVKKDSILFSGGLGYADWEQKVQVDRTTQFHLASITKFLLAMGVQKLIADGKLGLNDRLKSIAPEIPYTNQWEASHPVRIVHLLEHTAGFEDIQLNRMVNMTGKPLTGLEAVNAIGHSLTSRWKPGERMSYANPGYNVLGYIIEKVSGMPWDEYIQKALLGPLHMDHTLFDLDGKARPDYAKGYYHQDGAYHRLPFYMPGSNGASSALVSNASDMSRLMFYLLNAPSSGDAHPLNEQDFHDMETIHSTLAGQNGLQTGYALGNDLFPNNKKITFRGHNGKGEGFSSWIFFNRAAGLAYSISTNCNAKLGSVSQLIEEFLTKDLGAPALRSQPIDRSTIEPLLGYYQFMNPKNERWEFHRKIFGGIKLVAIDKDKLIVEKGRGRPDSLVHIGNGIFRSKGDIIPSFIVGRDHEGHPFFQGYGNGFFRKTAYAPVLLQQALIYLGLTAALLSIIYTIAGIPMVLLKKINIKDLWLTLWPTLGIVSFLVAYRILGITDEVHKELFTSMNGATFSIFAGMLFFGISVMIGAYLLYKRWDQLSHQWMRIPLAFNIIFLLYLTALFSIHGWIGVPIWAH